MRLLVKAQAPAKVEETTIGACNIESLKKLNSDPEYQKGYFLLFTQPSCPYCNTARGLMDEIVGVKKPMLEANLQDKECAKLADQMKVKITPAFFFYDEKGEEKKRLEPDGKLSWQNIQDFLKEFAA